MSSDAAAASDDDAPSPLQKRITDCQEAIKDQTENDSTDSDDEDSLQAHQGMQGSASCMP
jgi:hypothetical protein